MIMIDEETPLLRSSSDDTIPRETPLPWKQFSIVLFIQLAEPLTSQVISPFVPQLIRDLGITGGDDAKIGYYSGIMHSVFFIAEAATVLYWSRLSDKIGRKPIILTGLFGLALSMICFGLSTTFWGYIISRSLAGALNGNIGVMKSVMGELTDSTNIARAFAYFPIAWSTGAAIGQILPNFFALSPLRRQRSSGRTHVLTPRVLISAGNYAILSLIDIAFRTFQPLFWAMPIELGGLDLSPPRIGIILGFVGVGNGLFQALLFADFHKRLGTRTMYLVAVAALFPIIALFPLTSFLAKSYGVGAMVWITVGLQLTLMPLFYSSFGCVFMYVTASSPNKKSLGTMNGFSQTLVSITRGIGPSLANSLFSLWNIATEANVEQ
ncbi:MFS general substrate transporter [Rickenella mellea]|uniref:MFS general substrate transporter n=1 Tax=Rickenella mellea TaxID=50990 RepID=A0A4Y7PXM0_9AGAM|nr:MFS general substrate transporter [Rickenella mellea]